MSEYLQSFTVTMKHESAYRFHVDFEDQFSEFDAFITDEPEPMGTNKAPAPTHLLVAAVANCLSVSFMFAVNRAKQDVSGITTKATCHIGRNENRHFRVVKIDVQIQMGKNAEDIPELSDILSRFEGISTVSRSVLEGIPTETVVLDQSGRKVK